MKLFGFDVRVSRSPRTAPSRRQYASAKVDRMTNDWLTSNQTADELLRWNLRKLRERSRDLFRNNDYAKNFGRKLLVNVIGHTGIQLQNKAGDWSLTQKKFIQDKAANSMIEDAFSDWSRKKYAAVDGAMSFKDIQDMSLFSAAQDGEIFVRIVRGFDNKYRFALQFFEADHLDETYNRTLPNGNVIKMAIEHDAWGRPVMYHIMTRHPGENSYIWGATRYEPVPASDIIHLFVKDRPTQSRGVPWMHTAILRLRMLGAYEEASLIAARVGASKMGFIIPPEGEEYTGDGEDEKGDLIDEVEPGVLESLPAGSDFKSFDPNAPSGEFGPFNKAMLRGAAAGIGASYNSLANDLEGVNFSSLRAGTLEERDNWKFVQRWFTEHLHDDIFEAWLQMQLLTQTVPLPAAKFEKFFAPKWQARSWDWIDPVKDINAKIVALKAGLTTRDQLATEMGYDLEDLLNQLAEEKFLLESLGLTFSLETRPDAGSNQTEGGPQSEKDNQND